MDHFIDSIDCESRIVLDRFARCIHPIAFDELWVLFPLCVMMIFATI